MTADLHADKRGKNHFLLFSLVSKNQNSPHFGTLRKADEPSIAKMELNFMRDSNEEDWKEKISSVNQKNIN